MNCPRCRGAVDFDMSLVGQQVQCPVCQQIITVVPPNVPPLYGNVSASKTSSLAIASLVLSLSSFVGLGPLGCIPGIICGHLAKAEIRKNQSLEGEGLARAGLIIGYAILGLMVTAMLIILIFFVGAFTTLLSSSSFQRGFNSPPLPPPAQIEPIETAATTGGWTTDLAAMEFPETPAAGKIHEDTFTCEKARFEKGILTLRQGQEFFADHELMIFLFTKEGEVLEGKVFRISQSSTGQRPHVYKKWKQPGKNLPDQTSYTSGYVMRLEFGTIEDGKLPGKIYICLPDAEQSFVAGTFKAELPKSSGDKPPAKPKLLPEAPL